jgi:transcriptional regulator with XRE-family HTH domain
MKPVKSSVYRDIGFRVQKVREFLGYSQIKMAKQFGLTANAYRKIEKGDFKPGYHTLQKMAVGYDVSLDWLFFNKGPMIYKEKQEEPEPPKQVVEKIPREPESQLAPEIKEMVDQMDQDPLLRYEILIFFHRFRKKNKETTAPGKTDKKVKK